MMRKLFTVVFVIATFFASAQNAPRKEHYRFINPNMEPTLDYEKAMTHTDLDSLRFLNERRQIPIEGTNILIELYSANELLERYQKQINPLTIKDPAKARKVLIKLPPYKLGLIVIPAKNDQK